MVLGLGDCERDGEGGGRGAGEMNEIYVMDGWKDNDVISIGRIVITLADFDFRSGVSINRVGRNLNIETRNP